MRLIDADYVKSKLNKSALGGHLHYYVCGVIDDAPTIDAEPVKHGRWIETNDDTKKRCTGCNVIHLIAQYPHGNANYCPNCGAKMDLKDGEKNMNIELKPCPFCGGEAALVASSDSFTCQVRCTKCGAETREIENIGSYFTTYYSNALEAAELWNKRAGESE